MSEIKLMPCPFCGGEAFISCNPEAPIDTAGRMWAYTVVCASCCARSGLCYSVEMAKKYWNTRKPMQEIEQQPMAEAVVPARWKYYHKQNIAVCTNCSFERDLDANFGRAICCPNCGAKMDLS